MTIVYVTVRFRRSRHTSHYVYTWDAVAGLVEVGDLAVVDSPYGGLKLVEVMAVSAEPDARADKPLIGVVVVAAGQRDKAKLPDEPSYEPAFNDGPF